MTLREQAYRGFKWTTAGGIATSVFDFARFSVLAHLLVPGDFGLMAMIIVVLGFARAYADGGTSNAVIHRQDTTSNQLSSLFWLNIMAGVGLYVVIISASPLIASFYNEARLPGLLAWSGLVILITSLGSLHQVLLRKQLKFDAIAKIEVSAAAFSFVVAVLMGLLGYGVFALIGGQIAGSSLATSILLVIGLKDWRPSFRFKVQDLRGYFRFGMYQMGEHTLNYFGSKVDYLLIGRFLGADVLGLYMLAYELVLVPLKRINPILTRVAFPVFSQKQQNSPALRTGYVELSKLLGVLVFPFMACMGVLAPLFVPIVFGPGWEQAIPLIQILALTGLIKAMGNPSGSIILALGRADLSFYWNLFTAIFTSVVFWFAVQHGVYALAMAYLLISVLYFAAGQELLINRLIHLSWPEYLKVFLYPLIISMLMSVIIYSGYLYFTSTQMLEVVSLAVLIVLSLLVYLPGIWFSERKFLSGLAGIIFNKS